ncbi:hypothetical protein AMS68_007734 [Peltaster fructicola]|uniref:Uncharacterized protein n=1 Tax=Peltaster fructicola TaxID=286661 RepID=A0A6H0Y592_9PEZI|nr:hypothetical protein AMS68_007734 [Peltaster fructicola]
MSDHAAGAPTLDEIDEVLYLVRVNEAEELQTYLDSLAQQYSSSVGTIIPECVDPESGNTVLHYCAANGFADLMPKLLQAVQTSHPGATNGDIPTHPFVNQQNGQGNTALHWGALNGHLPIVKQLIEARADMWVKNAAGHLAMFEAERAEKNEVVQYLLEAGGKEVENTGSEGLADVDMDSEATTLVEQEAEGSG